MFGERMYPYVLKSFVNLTYQLNSMGTTSLVAGNACTTVDMSFSTLY